ncbi:MAG: DUF6328 family protein [Solirubrobacterales bacterium]
MATDPNLPETAPEETAKQRTNRELIELLNELRVALPGVQVMFAFLLAVPLSTRFPEIGDNERAIFYVTLSSTAIATALLIAPSAIHRIDFRNEDKASMILLFNKLAIAGLFFTAWSMIGALTFIAALLYATSVAAIVFTLSTATFSLLWFYLPIRRRMKRPDDPRRPD